jgi:hypothetical protein
MAALDAFLKELSRIEKSLPASLQGAVVSLKHGLGALSIETIVSLEHGLIKGFFDDVRGQCKCSHHTVDEHFDFFEVFIDVDGEKETWRFGTEKMFYDYLIDEYETDDERSGF